MLENIDYKFISDLEGGRITTGYVPAVKSSNSGVTIATGFDLGQRSRKDLESLNVGKNLIEILSPYLGLTKQAAKDKLIKSPLVISDLQAEQIDKLIKAQETKRIIFNYNRSSKTKFEDLPSQAQTVIASVSFQYGSNLKLATPIFWKAVTEQNWEKTIKILKDFGDAYPTRRKKEAKLLETIK